MAMTMAGTVTLPADRATVWAALNDPEMLKSAIPGCQELTAAGEGFAAVAKVAVGPVKATFKGQVTLSDIDPPNGYTITGEGQGGVAGFAKGGAKVRLEDADEGGTRLSYDVEAQVGGKIAQLGGRLINGVAKKYADEFFANFAKALNPVAPAP
jgi:carbon monoxide dehydrogenase subunit G